VIKHSPAAIADSSLCLRRGSKRSTPNAGSRRPCDVSRAGRNEKPIETLRAADTTAEDMAPMAAAETEVTLRVRVSSIRRFAPIAAARPRCRSFRAPTNPSIAGIASRQCAANSNHAIPTISRSVFVALDTRPDQSGRVCFYPDSASDAAFAASWSWRM
jgi:hypothetical protein